MTDSYMQKTADGTVIFAGRDAVDLYRVTVLRSAIKLYAKTGIKATRLYTPTTMLRAAGGITGKTYRRGQFALAIADLSVVIEEMRANVKVREG